MSARDIVAMLLVGVLLALALALAFLLGMAREGSPGLSGRAYLRRNRAEWLVFVALVAGIGVFVVILGVR